LNNDFVHKQAAALAARVKDAGGEEVQIRKAFEIAYQRDPSADELAAAMALLHDTTVASPAVTAKPVAYEAKPESAAKAAKRPESPLEALCWALLSSNEFLFLN